MILDIRRLKGVGQEIFELYFVMIRAPDKQLKYFRI